MAIANLYDSSNESFLYDLTKVTAIMLLPAQNQLSVYCADGELVRTDTRSKKIDLESLLKKLSANGNDMFRFSNEMKFFEGPATMYVAPRAVSLINTAIARDGFAAMEVVMAGQGSGYRCDQTDVAEIQALADAVKAVKPMMEMDGADVGCKWVRPGKLWLDTKDVFRIEPKYDNSLFIRVNWGGQLELELKKYSEDGMIERVNAADSAGKLAFREAFEKAGGIKAYQIQEARGATAKLAQDIAKGHPELFLVPGTKYPAYIRAQDFDVLMEAQRDYSGVIHYDLHLQKQASNNQNWLDPIHLYFNSKVDRDHAVQVLLDLRYGAKPTSAPKPARKP